MTASTTAEIYLQSAFVMREIVKIPYNLFCRIRGGLCTGESEDLVLRYLHRVMRVRCGECPRLLGEAKLRVFGQKNPTNSVMM